MSAIATSSSQSTNISSTPQAADVGLYLTFMLGGGHYALGILNIRELINYGQLTEVPMMPSFVRGVINLRGAVVPVIDLAARFGKGDTVIAKRTAIVIVEAANDDEHGAHKDFGILVDAVSEVVEISRRDIEPPPSFGTGIRLDFISGMAKRNERFIIVLNVNRVLSVDDMAALSATVSGAHQSSAAIPSETLTEENNCEW